jgi:glycerol uptake facilitator-like aquaporin
VKEDIFYENKLVEKEEGKDFWLGVFSIFMLEFLGTAGLIWAINLTGNHPLGISCILVTLVMITGPITGGHLSPAVSTAVFIIRYKNGFTRNIGWLLLYLTAEYLGATFGILCASLSKNLTIGGVASFPMFMPRAPDGAEPISTGAAWFTEFFCTFWFMTIIMHAKEVRLTSNFKNTILFILSVAISLGGVI